MRHIVADIKEKTSNMTRRETWSYILTYYWYHILGSVSIIALILLFGIHYLTGNQHPVFTCVMVNQEVDSVRDKSIENTFSAYAELPSKRVVVDSGYNFSYGTLKLEGVNESAYERFFFQWQNKELDAVVMPESFYEYCRELGGEFRELDGIKEGTFQRYMDGDSCIALVLGNDSLSEKISGKTDEKLLLVFPKTGKHEESCHVFVKYLCDVKEGKVEV